LRLNVEADDPEELRLRTQEVLAMIRPASGISGGNARHE
jgi:hypothetical protein